MRSMSARRRTRAMSKPITRSRAAMPGSRRQARTDPVHHTNPPAAGTSSSSGANTPMHTTAEAPRRQEAKASTRTRITSPPADTSSGASHHVHTTVDPPRRRTARTKPDAIPATPSVDTTSSGATETMQTTATSPRDDRQGAIDLANTSSSAPPAEPSDDAVMAICLKLADLQKVRRFCIVSQSRCDRSMQAAIARCIGYDNTADEADRRALFKRAAAIMKAVEQGKPFDPPLPPGDQRQETLDNFLPLIPLNALSREPWDKAREDAERAMRKLAQQLPVFAWVQKNAKGVGDLGLARIVGEAPLLGQYATHERLWKRMGVAVVAGERQQRRSDKNEALLHGFAPTRRAELWSVCSDTLFRAQWRGAKEAEDGEITEGYPVGPYGAVYQRRKALTLPRIAETDALPYTDRAKWTRRRCDNDARRVMSKEFLRDLWSEWTGHTPRHPARWAAAQKTEAAAA